MLHPAFAPAVDSSRCREYGPRSHNESLRFVARKTRVSPRWKEVKVMTLDVLALELLLAEFAKDKPTCNGTCGSTCTASKALN